MLLTHIVVLTLSMIEFHTCLIFQNNARFTRIRSVPLNAIAIKLLKLGDKPITGRILNGTQAAMKNVRHQVSLRRREMDDLEFGLGHICGGSLIKLNVVLSAAHCFVDQQHFDGKYLPLSDFIIVMGILDRFEQDKNTLTFHIAGGFFGYPEPFNQNTYDRDIALLFLDGAVPNNHPLIRPIALAVDAVDPGTMCHVTGWGETEDGFNSDMLMTVDVPLISDHDCKYNSDLNSTVVLSGMLCAGYLKEGIYDACSGDSGGPLVCSGILTGIVSWGIRCGEPMLPGVYTDVAYYKSWIDDHIAKHAQSNLDTTTFDPLGNESYHYQNLNASKRSETLALSSHNSQIIVLAVVLLAILLIY